MYNVNLKTNIHVKMQPQ